MMRRSAKLARNLRAQAAKEAPHAQTCFCPSAARRHRGAPGAQAGPECACAGRLDLPRQTGCTQLGRPADAADRAGAWLSSRDGAPAAARFTWAWARFPGAGHGLWPVATVNAVVTKLTAGTAQATPREQ